MSRPNGRTTYGLRPARAELRALRLEQRREALHAVQIDHGDLGAHQPVEQQVALQRRPLLAVQQDQRHLEAELARRAGDLTAPVGLGVGAGDHRVGARRQNVGEQELELARLVAAEREPGQVVALDPDVGPAERRAEARAVLERRRQMGEPHPRQGVDPRLQRRPAQLRVRSRP